MAEAYIVEAVRTPVGRRRGGLSAEHPADLGAHVLNALVERSKIDPSTVDDVILGCSALRASTPVRPAENASTLGLTLCGWMTGLEPATTGTTSQCSTN